RRPPVAPSSATVVVDHNLRDVGQLIETAASEQRRVHRRTAMKHQQLRALAHRLPVRNPPCPIDIDEQANTTANVDSHQRDGTRHETHLSTGMGRLVAPNARLWSGLACLAADDYGDESK